MSEVTNFTVMFEARGLEEVNAKLAYYNATLTKLKEKSNGMYAVTGKVGEAQDNLSKSTNNVADATDRASKSHENYIWHITKTTMLSAAVNKAFLMLVESMGKAVQQVDLMQNFPASMGALGLSTKDASESFLKLRGYIAGIGGDLTEATTSVARFAEVTKNVKAATAEFVGVKNAIIAGGAGTQVQANALEQLIQAYSRGKPQLIEWKTMMVAMPAQLNQVAQSMGLINAQALGEALTSGEVSMQNFMTKLTELSTGTGPIANQAIARMQGIQFATNVMTNTLTNGLAAIYNAIGRSNIVNFFGAVTQVISVLANWTVVLINLIIDLINVFARLFGGKGIQRISGETADVANNLADGASSAGDLSDGLDDAGESAKKLSKSLAPFDKMNVLPDKTSGSSGGKGAGAGAGGVGLDAGTAAELEGIFDGIGGKIKEASIWAKIFAGALLGLAGLKLLPGIIGWLKTVIDGFKAGRKNAWDFKDALKGVNDEAEKSSKTLGSKLGNALKNAVTNTSTIASAAGGFVGSLIGAISTALAAAVGWLAASIAGPIIDAFIIAGAAIAGAIGVSLGAGIAIAVAAVAAIVAVVWLIWANWQTIWGFITTSFTNFWNWLVGLWNTLYDIFKGPVEWLLQFVTNVGILIVAVIATLLETAYKLVVGAIQLIFTILGTIAMWIYNNVISPVISFFTGMWTAIVQIFKTAWFLISNFILAPIGNWINTNVIQPVLSFFRTLWNNVTSFVSGFITNIKNIMSPITNWIKVNIIDKISGFFNGLWDGIKNGMSSLMESLRNIFNGLVNIFKSPMNGVIDALNGMFRNLNKSVKVPDWVPGLGGKGVNFPMIPRLATGGVVEKATLAMIGESGKEAVVPLENNTEWIDKLASKINSAGGGQPIQLVVQIGEDKVASKIIDLINEKTQMSGRNAILV